MKKKTVIWIILVALMAVLFVPVPTIAYKDGGTQVYQALTYKIIKWERFWGEDVFRATNVYFFPKNFKSDDELFEEEIKKNEISFKAVVLEIGDGAITVEPFADEEIRKTADKISFATGSLRPIGVQKGSEVEVFFLGEVMTTYPAQINPTDWKLIASEDECTEISSNVFAADKPVIYLYPERKTDVTVSLRLNGELTCTYPEYNNGWQVTAEPEGTITDKQGKEYNYLYWEAELNNEYDFSKGFCVKGEDTSAFLETALEKLGLNRKEANEFIVYWLPLMQDNPYNIISFQTTLYENSAKLNINPTPDTLIRVFMAYKPVNEYEAIEEQELTSPKRNGFVAVEWGGAEVK